MTGFGERVRAAIAQYGHLCVGIDPHAALLSSWGMDATAAGAREFGLRVVEAAAGHVGIVKPQVSFFERYGAAGFAALEDVLRAGRDAGLVVIADAKRGDIGSTMDAYAQAWLTPGSPLEADALTASPFLGVEALSGAFALAERSDKGVLVLAATSNADAFGQQRALLQSGDTVSAHVIAEVSERNAQRTTAGQWADLGFVVGATVEWQAAGLRVPAPPTPILAPGFGHQGAEPTQLTERFGAAAPTVIASESRSILAAGPDRLAAHISRRAEEYVRG
ncbi:orotidine-5'-phosphate decarboxylase [Microbacterium protaetiae]|uniref:Orotidine-5'-phosphate decarboxylase n=1 Tax=Microbacterium protaetiae TaxID=2509458 RepID=A0A4P6ET76_9MICO|nr:orotidine-5'-phosphate decarboxylase [Microbacterium protaetiae]QAY61238.1 orotidine-5'-phosphate decarboxylase [Microbacterium protaetiae]